jgi:SAM-dependent MidA family methyltransferase
MSEALYGPDGFYTRPGRGPAAHFRTSVHASPLFAGALARLLSTVDTALGRPDPLDVVDVGAGRGELLTAVLAAVPRETAARIRATAVELAPAPDNLPAPVSWTAEPPAGITGLLFATEWLDNVPVDVAAGGRYVLEDGSAGPPVEPADAEWLDRWWPDGSVAEVGVERDAAWAGVVGRVSRGLAVAIDYGHLREDRPVFGTLTGYREGRQLPPVADGSSDVTAHVAIDSAADAGAHFSTVPPKVLKQREALRALGVDGARPPLALARQDPARYMRDLAAASLAAELTDPAGLGDHYWIVQPVGIPLVIPGVF